MNSSKQDYIDTIVGLMKTQNELTSLLKETVNHLLLEENATNETGDLIWKIKKALSKAEDR